MTTAATTAHTLTVGTILSSSWGYDQTNICYYEVVKATRTQVTLQELAHWTVDTTGYSDSVYPAMGDTDERFKKSWVHFDAAGNLLDPPVQRIEAKTRKVHTWTDRNGEVHYSVRMSSYEHASVWTGGARHQTGAMYGH